MLLIKTEFLRLHKETCIPQRAFNAKFKLHRKRGDGEHFPRYKVQVTIPTGPPTFHFLWGIRGSKHFLLS